MDTDCIHDVSKTETQVSLGKDRLEKVSQAKEGGWRLFCL